MSIEGKYLDKNFYIKDNTIFKTTGVSTTWFSVVNDIKLIFFLSYDQSCVVLETWVRDKGVSPEDLYMFNGDTIGFITDEDNEYVFPINEFSHSTSQERIEMPLSFGRSLHYIHGRVDHEIKIQVFKTHQDERFVDYLLAKPYEAYQERASKFTLTIISKKQSKYICEGCLLSEINYDIDRDYDDDIGHYGSELKFNFTIKPDNLRVELMSDEF